jgi:hypothetical protein
MLGLVFFKITKNTEEVKQGDLESYNFLRVMGLFFGTEEVFTKVFNYNFSVCKEFTHNYSTENVITQRLNYYFK